MVDLINKFAEKTGEKSIYCLLTWLPGELIAINFS